ncbi:MAG: MmcQ/YjbR family DNA-binding protein [Euzebya sp.]
MDIDSRRDRLIEMIDLLPEATSEEPGEGIQHIGFSVRKKRFAWYLDDHHGDGVVAMTCKAAAGVNTELPAANPDRFFKPSYTGSRGWIGIRLDVETVDWDEVGRFLEDAYRLTAPKSLVAILDKS